MNFLKNIPRRKINLSGWVQKERKGYTFEIGNTRKGDNILRGYLLSQGDIVRILMNKL